MAAEEKSKTLETVTDYITDARTLLLDNVQPYRYDDPSLLIALNVALLEGRRLRPDIFVYHHQDYVPSFSTNAGQEIKIEPQFRVGFVYGLIAHALMRDQESVEDIRATAFYNMFVYILTGVKPPPIQGGTPQAPQKR